MYQVEAVCTIWCLEFVFTCCKVIRRICVEGFNDQREGALRERERGHAINQKCKK
jgi:hypothetical protein